VEITPPGYTPLNSTTPTIRYIEFPQTYPHYTPNQRKPKTFSVQRRQAHKKAMLRTQLQAFEQDPHFSFTLYVTHKK